MTLVEQVEETELPLVNIDKIQLGWTGNYKNLCLYLDLPIMAGNAKTQQIEELSRYCVLHKEGVRYTIVGIYNEVQDKPSRKGNEELDRWGNLLLDYLAGEDKDDVNDVFIPKWRLYNICGFMDEYYYTYRQAFLSEGSQPGHEHIPVEHVDSFFKSSNSIFSDTLRSVFRSLETKKILNVDYTYRGYDREREVERLVTFDEKTRIMQIEYSLLKDLGYKSEYLIPIRAKSDYYERKTKAIEKELGLEKIYKGYRLGFTKGIADKKLKYILDGGSRGENESVARVKMGDKILTLSTRKYNKWKKPKVAENGFSIGKMGNILEVKDSCLARIYTEGYVENMEELVELLVKVLEVGG